MVVIIGIMIIVTVEREERSKTKSTYANQPYSRVCPWKVPLLSREGMRTRSCTFLKTREEKRKRRMGLRGR
jgi:hypothetical protein